MDWVQYWFMFPVAMGVATCAMLSGIGGAAMFIPIFAILFPILGPEYALPFAAAVGAALMTQVFGFASGFIGYYRKRLIDFRSAMPFLTISIPIAIGGGLLLAELKEQEVLLKGAYAMLMLGLCPVILRHTPPRKMYIEAGSEGPSADGREVRVVTDRAGHTYTFRKPRVGIFGALITGLGSFLTGLLGVGVGEVIMPQLVKRNHVPVAVAAATSVFVVIVTIASASFTQVMALIAAGGIDAVPWNLVCYSVPGVVIGGQIGPWLQGRVAQRAMERAVAILFGFIGLAMGYIALTP